MTQRLEAARAAMAHAIAIYVPTHIYAEACAALTLAAVELEHAARVEDDKPSDPPMTLEEADGPVKPDPLPTTGEAVADALAPYEAPPVPEVEPTKPPKSRNKAK